MATKEGAQEQKVTGMPEDWAIVLVGFLIIITTLVGFIVPVPAYSWAEAGDFTTRIFSGVNLGKIVEQFLYVFVAGALTVVLLRKPLKVFITVFPVVALLTFIALILAGSAQMEALKLEAVIFSLTIGLLVGNTVKLPGWFREGLSAELFVKIGLVLLGTTINFNAIVKDGLLGLVQALVVVVSVWYFAYWVCKRFKLDDELSLMLSSAVSICGVSAAIATAGAIKGDPKKLSYIISLVLITAIPMMIFMPYIADYFGFSQKVTGAWLGGSIDTTGAVVASGTLAGEVARETSTIVKFSQNVLLGLAAFAISIYWTYAQKTPSSVNVEKPTLRLIWDRFPKFVLGFVAASILFSFIIKPAQLGAEKLTAVKDSLKSIQTLWFVLAFTSIGLETKFSDLFNNDSKKPLYAFLLAQLFNIIITLVIAFLLFG
jgi:uncharacterized integral membrane protein (TIGR00698 family)